MDLIIKLKNYLGQKDEENLRISSKYEWEILKPLFLIYFRKFEAKQKESEKRFYCLFVTNDFSHERIEITEECEKCKSIVLSCDRIKINDIIILFYEEGESLKNPIDEKKLLEMFIELNEINIAGSRDLPGSKIMIRYWDDEIVLINDSYQIHPTSVYIKQIHKGEYLIAKEIFKIFKDYNLKLTDKIKRIHLDCKEKECNLSPREHLEYLAEGNLNRRLRALI